MESIQTEEEFLETEEGRFLFEVKNSVAEAHELIDASLVDDGVKKACKEVFGQFVVLAERQTNILEGVRPFRDIHDVCRATLISLMKILDRKGDEEDSLYAALKDVVLKTSYSAKGWSWPPQRP